jgi:hypothetical protein
VSIAPHHERRGLFGRHGIRNKGLGPLRRQPEIDRYKKSISVKPINATINQVQAVCRCLSNSLLASVCFAFGLRDFDLILPFAFSPFVASVSFFATLDLACWRAREPLQPFGLVSFLSIARLPPSAPIAAKARHPQMSKAERDVRTLSFAFACRLASKLDFSQW